MSKILDYEEKFNLGQYDKHTLLELLEHYKNNNVKYKTILKKGFNEKYEEFFDKILCYYKDKKYVKFINYIKIIYEYYNQTKIINEFSKKINYLYINEYLLRYNKEEDAIKFLDNEGYTNIMANYYIEKKEFEKCEKYLIEHGISEGNMSNLGTYYIKTNQIEKAINIFNDLIKNKNIYGYLGIISVLDCFDKKLLHNYNIIIDKKHYLDEAHHLFPVNDLLWERIACYYIEIYQFDKAIKFCLEGIESDIDSIYCYRTLVACYHNIKNYELSLNYLKIYINKCKVIEQPFEVDPLFYKNMKDDEMLVGFVILNIPIGLINIIKLKKFNLLENIKSKLIINEKRKCGLCYEKKTNNVLLACVNHIICFDCFKSLVKINNLYCPFCKYNLETFDRLIM